MMPALLATKLHRPTPPAKRVHRSHLLRRLDEGLAAGRRLSLVSAPAGFGKTSCVSEWLDGVALPVAWLSLEPADDDPARFLAYLVAALQTVDERLGREPAASLQAGQNPPLPSLITTLLNDILSARRKFVLVLDDFHVIRDGAILDALARLIAGASAELHLVLVTREDPLLPLARLRANNQLTEIRAADLRFSQGEAGHLLNELMELALSEADIAALENRTEGWVAGLQLAGLSMCGRPDPSGFIAALTGSHRFILSYLTEEVLDRQPVEIRSFLLQTSILDKLNGELCEAVVGRPDCGALLERLCAANLFLIPLDDDREWYRYHHLFAQLLSTRLRQALPTGEVQALHGRASDWFAGRGFLDDAIKHALAGKDFERAVGLVDGVARTMIFAGRMHTLRDWLAAFPAAARVVYPRLDYYRAWIDLLEAKPGLAEKAMQEREAALLALPPSPENDRLRVELTVVLCRYSPVFGNTARTIRLAKEALQSVPEGELVTRARLIFALAVAHDLEGNAVEGELAFQDCLRLARAAGDDGLVAEILGLVAHDQSHHGRLREAAQTYQAIVDLGTREGQAEFYPAGQGLIGLAGIYLERNELERAGLFLEQGMELCARGGLDGIYAGYGIKSRLYQARGDLAGAMAELDALDQAFQRGDDPDKLARRIAIVRTSGDLGALSRWIEPWTKLLAVDPAGDPVGDLVGDLVALRPPGVVLEIIRVLVARVCLAQGELGRAIELLNQVQATAEPGRRFAPLIEVHLLKAEVLQENPSLSETPALACFERALDLAEPEGYVRLFVEEGPAVITLLRAVAEHAAAPERLKSYARRLLSAFPEPAGVGKAAIKEIAPHSEPALPAAPAALGAAESAPVEPLSPRELEILRLIGEGCTNQEIAGRLVITLHTVKKHSSNLFGKLEVTSRTQAVARARRLGLL